MDEDNRLAAVVRLHPEGAEGLGRHPAERMFAAMLDGWRSQQLARGLSFSTIDARHRAVCRFQAHSNEWPGAGPSI